MGYSVILRLWIWAKVRTLKVHLSEGKQNTMTAPSIALLPSPPPVVSNNASPARASSALQESSEVRAGSLKLGKVAQLQPSRVSSFKRPVEEAAKQEAVNLDKAAKLIKEGASRQTQRTLSLQSTNSAKQESSTQSLKVDVQAQDVAQRAASASFQQRSFAKTQAQASQSATVDSGDQNSNTAVRAQVADGISTVQVQAAVGQQAQSTGSSRREQAKANATSPGNPTVDQLSPEELQQARVQSRSERIERVEAFLESNNQVEQRLEQLRAEQEQVAQQRDDEAVQRKEELERNVQVRRFERQQQDLYSKVNLAEDSAAIASQVKKVQREELDEQFLRERVARVEQRQSQAKIREEENRANQERVEQLDRNKVEAARAVEQRDQQQRQSE